MSKKLLAKKLIKSLSSTKGVKQSTLDNPFFGSFYKNVPSPTPLSKKIIHMGELVPQRYRNMLDAADIKGGHLLGSKKPGALDVEYNRYLNFMEDKPTKKLNKGEFKNMFFVSQSKKQKLEKLADDELKKSLSSIPLEKSSKKGMFDKNVELYNNMSQKNKNKMEEIFSTIDIAGGKGTISKQKLKSHIGRIINQAVEKQGLPEDAVVDHIIKSQINPFILGPLLNKRNLANPEIARAIKAGRLTEGDRPHLSHINPVSKDWTKAMKSENIFYGPAKLNLKTGAKKQEKIDDYLDDIGESIMGMDYPYGKMASKGGLIKKGIQKLLDSTAFNQSRRKFLKQSGAAVAAAGVPKSLLKGASTLAQASKLSLPNAVPWVRTMTNMLKGAVDSKKPVTKLPNGTEIFYMKGPKYEWDKTHQLSVKTADGKEDLINFREYKDDIEIEFDIRDDFHNNQAITVDKKTGYTEMIDDNFRMAPGGEDIIKDDPIVWAIERGGKNSDNYTDDFMSVPDDTEYGYLFERYVDSFSPSGNIFNTKKYAQAEKAQKLKQDKMDKIREENREMLWEEQFRGGRGIHGYYRGGTSMRDYPQRPTMDFDRVLNAMSMVESSNNPKAMGPLRRTAIFADPSSDRPRERHERAHGLFQILPSTARQP